MADTSTDSLTDREAFAAVLARLVLARCMASGSNGTERDALQASVPLNERPYVRRGLDALVEHGALCMIGDDIGFTGEGNAFLAYVKDAEADDPDMQDADRHAGVMPLRTLIAQDTRLVPPKSIDAIRTLPGRLENYEAPRRSGLWNRWTLALGLGLVACAAIVMSLD